MAPRTIAPARTAAGRRRLVRNFNNSLEFISGSSYETVTTSTLLDTLGAAAQSFWAYMECRIQKSASTIRLLEKYNGSGRYPFALRVETDGRLAAVRFNGTTTFGAFSTQRFSDNQWHAVLAYLTGTTMTLYVDGTQAGTGTFGELDDDMTNSHNLEIGRRSGASPSFTGAMQTVALGTGTLTSDQIAALSFNGQMPSTGTLLLHLKNDEGTGNPADYSGNAHSVSVTSTVWSTNSLMKSRTLRA